MTLRRSLLAAALTGGLLFTAACSGDDLAKDDDANDDSSGGGKVTLASQSFDEAALVTAMYAEILDDLGYDVETKLVDTRSAYLSEFPGSVDIVPEYVAGLGDQLNTDANGEDAAPISSSDLDATLEAMQPLLDDKGITLLDTSGAASQNAYFVTQAYSDDNGVTKLSDLEGQSITLAAAPDCTGRDDCEAGLIDVYGIDITLLPLGYASPQTYQSVIDGESQLGQTGTLDGTLDDQGLVLLEDDRGIQPAQNLVPAVSSDFLADHPDVEAPLNALMAALDNATLGELIAQVTVDRESPEDVAEKFLEDNGLVD
ncbi:amino acid ABC transporter substrate-binding protein [Nocardioides humilatus]|uniref:Amino acid ABC transporter substrate-binding protein n=1 Tax=Nocardioides humilatus TaxID=2607660 RepID=A0A5B1LIZ5_9ACTN|nr:glycine betaine ABC transporter substrate-binding protein [Nocardioides humilatus]KAA1419567.1 amino acid ABC transporter substrate-binding protein [Nocardioides humilatus]